VETSQGPDRRIAGPPEHRSGRRPRRQHCEGPAGFPRSWPLPLPPAGPPF